MLLKSVELYGFKSFANKMIFKFDKGITGVVGPNGSGKSNIADAIRWVLGEQSAKTLRGSKMEDVIFAGTEVRRPLGYCQVDLTIDNSDKKLSIDYNEITVSRRVYRSGESGYYLNGSSVRLKDIHEIFMDTGVGQEGYSIIGQGQVEKILSNKPTERRILIDEAAGIVKYKTRKNEAIKKLENSEVDLERVLDIISELEIQKNSLDEQAKVAKIYLSKREELKKLEVTAFVRLIDEFDLKLNELKNNEKIAVDNYNNYEKAYNSYMNEYKILEDKFKNIDIKLDSLRENIQSTNIDIEKHKSSIKLSNEKIKNSEERVSKLKQDAENIQNTDLNKNIKLNELKKELETICETINIKNEEVLDLEKVYLEIQNDIVKNQKELECMRKTIFDNINNSSNIKMDITTSKIIIENNKKKINELQSKILINNRIIIEAETELSKALKDYEQKEIEQKIYLDNKMGIRKKINIFENNLLIKKQEMIKKQNFTNKLKSRHEALSDMQERYDGFYYSVKKVMELANENVLGVVSDLIDVDKRYGKAIEIALGSNIQNIVTKDVETAKKLIYFLKKNRYGRSTFLPMTTISGSLANNIAIDKGYIGLASEIIDYDLQFKPIIRQLLGRVLIVDNLDNATIIAKKNNHRFRVITLDGDVISPGGAMSGGAFNKEKNAILSRKNEIEELSFKIKENENSLKIELNEISSKEVEISRLKNQIEDIVEKEQDLNIKLNNSTNSINILKNDLNKYKKDRSEFALEEEELKKENIELNELKITHENKLVQDQETNKELENKIVEISEYIETLNADKEELSKELSFVKLAHNTEEINKSNLEKEIERINRDSKNLTENLNLLQKEISQLDINLLKEKELIISTKANKQKLEEILENYNKNLVDLKADRVDIQVNKGQMDAKREESLNKKNLLDKELVRIHSGVEKQEALKETRINYMWEEYELTYSNAIELKLPLSISDKEIKENSLNLKNEIKNLGDVNVRAIQEFREVKERFEFLSVQRDDLIESKNKLLTIISELDEEMKNQFTEKFNSINKMFNKVFKELFGGGQGHLELLDKENILESGISISVQPPGKKLQNMMLLSGGERSFTAIALLFAIQSLRPSPFCVLDEIEAALDDANVDRFARYLERLATETQFIVITHRKGTMEAADALYGITMQEKGVSTQVSVKLIEKQLES